MKALTFLLRITYGNRVCLIWWFLALPLAIRIIKMLGYALHTCNSDEGLKKILNAWPVTTCCIRQPHLINFTTTHPWKAPFPLPWLAAFPDSRMCDLVPYLRPSTIPYSRYYSPRLAISFWNRSRNAHLHVFIKIRCPFLWFVWQFSHLNPLRKEVIKD